MSSHGPNRHGSPEMSGASAAAFDPPDQSSAPPIERLRNALPPDGLLSWMVTLLVTALAFILRLVNLGQPGQLMFDESLYAKDAFSLLTQGFAGSWAGDFATIDPLFVQGDHSGLTNTVEWSAHPPGGLWLIAFGQAVFGPTPFGWRIASLVFGALLVLVTIRLARRLSRSTLIGALAGVLLSVDGLAFVMSRLALLDIFQAVFVVAGVLCVVADRDQFRNRLADIMSRLPGQTLGGRPGPCVFRPWLLGAGVLFGLGCAVKWNTVYALAVFGVLAVVSSVAARRTAGAGRRLWLGLLLDGGPAFVATVVVAAAVYVATWIPWLISVRGHDGVLLTATGSTQHHFTGGLRDLWLWHLGAYQYHTGPMVMTTTHPYASNPWGWPVAASTTGIFAETGIAPGDQGCAAAAGTTCLRVITALGTPVLWWAASLALVAGLVWGLARRDARFVVPLAGFGAMWLPWVIGRRVLVFSYYGVTMIPFLVIALAVMAGVILGPSLKAWAKRPVAAALAGLLLVLISANFAFMFPLYTARLLTEHQYSWRTWLPGWI